MWRDSASRDDADFSVVVEDRHRGVARLPRPPELPRGNCATLCNFRLVLPDDSGARAASGGPFLRRTGPQSGDLLAGGTIPRTTATVVAYAARLYRSASNAIL
jgi:hypothetical protein